MINVIFLFFCVCMYCTYSYMLQKKNLAYYCNDCKVSICTFACLIYSRCDSMNLRQSFPIFPSSASLARYYKFSSFKGSV